MWTFQQTSGQLIDPTGKLAGSGYSGHGLGVNNPTYQTEYEVGPIPQGKWGIGKPYSSPQHGSLAIPLTPDPSTDTFGRSGFLIHGDNVQHVGEELASLGCIVMPLETRKLIISSLDKILEVVS